MLGKTKKIHFVGIGGIGMSGIAELLLNQGFEISGSDLTETEITRNLAARGVRLHIGHDAGLIENADVVVKSSAVHDENPEVAAALEYRIPVIRRAEMLAEIMRMSYGIGIAGTHGKTTATSMVGSILSEADLDPTVIVGGIVKNYGSNNLLGSGKYIVVEADEFDRSFLSLSPIISGITNIDADHLDCYRDLNGVKDAFIEYANKVPFFGSVIACLDDKGVQAIIPRINKDLVTYGFSTQARIRAQDIKMKDFKSSFRLYFDQMELGEINLNVPGEYNILNSLLAVGVGLQLEIDFERIRKGLKAFNGVYRRFEKKGLKDGILVYDDYAHHPTEIAATLRGVRAGTDRRIITLFQPHLYSRTRDFHEEFGRSFFQSDVLVVCPIYPAREKPIPGITGELIAKAARKSGHKNVIYIETNDQIVARLRNILVSGDILITMGAGTVYKFGDSFLNDQKKEKNI